jgi:hypothetical protein
VTELEGRRQIESWIAWVRIFAVPFAVVEVGLISEHYPAGYERWAWAITGVFAVGAIAIWLLARRDFGQSGTRWLAFGALAFDTAVVGAFVLFYYSFEPNTAIRQILFLPVAEAAVRYGIVGGIVLPLVLAPFIGLGEHFRADRYDRDFNVDAVTFPLGVEILMGLIVGWLSMRLRREARTAEARAAEAEELRDRLGRRADQLEAVNLVARALGSSLEQEAAFDRFLAEVRNVFAFERLAIVLVEGDQAVVMAT